MNNAYNEEDIEDIDDSNNMSDQQRGFSIKSNNFLGENNFNSDLINKMNRNQTVASKNE
jgi:hypothetical protein